VAFISRGGVRPDSDYCINGKRVRLSDNGEVYAYDLTQADVDLLGLHLLAKYADYCTWHVQKKYGRPDVYGDMTLQPFDTVWPLRGRCHSSEPGEPKWLVDLFAAGAAAAEVRR
jgi:hypothetical protein